MRAWTYNKRGLPSQVLKLQHDFPQPQPTELKQNEVLMKISHISLFAVESRLMSFVPHRNSDPWLPGREFSGTVVAVPDNAMSYAPGGLRGGDEVFGMTDPRDFRYNGIMCEYAIVPRESIVSKPAVAKMDQASGLASGGCANIGIAEKAALLGVESSAGGLKIVSKATGKRILVTGGSTSVGIIMLQLARTLVGPTGFVATTCSPRHNDALAAMGADSMIDYTKHQDLHIYLAQNYAASPFDVIIDYSGSHSQLWPSCPAYLKSDGYFVFAGAMPVTHATLPSGFIRSLSYMSSLVGQVCNWGVKMFWPVMLGGIPRKCFFHSGVPNARDMELTRQLVEEGKLKGVVDSVWKMEDALKAYDHLAKGRIRGKVVVSVQE